ncbi:MAG: hypothetical protein JWO93_2528 [Micrococcaceae bacterium]|nr:hypothetical protein [Micrococcaceae bacterium]
MTDTSEHTSTPDRHPALVVADGLADAKSLDVVARFGFAVTGVLHILIGAIALRIAFGGAGKADPGGAIELLAQQPFGAVLLWAGFIGCGGLALWQFFEATVRARHLEGGARWSKGIASGSLSIGYGSIAATLARFAVGRGSDSGQSSRDFTASILQWSLGVEVLLAVAAVVTIIGIYFIVKALTKKFKTELHFENSRRGHLMSALGVVGHIAKGVALILLGVLIGVAAVKHSPEESTGLDGSLRALTDQPYGAYALSAIACGLVCYGVFAVVRSRYGRM